jgi:hypothetical protein
MGILGRTLNIVTDGWSAVVAWSAGVSAAGAGVAALLADSKTGWQHVLFVSFVVIAVVAFVILIGTGAWLVVSRFRAWRDRQEASRTSSTAPPPEKASETPSVLVQENVAQGQGTVYGALGGNVIVHNGGVAESSGDRGSPKRRLRKLGPKGHGSLCATSLSRVDARRSSTWKPVKCLSGTMSRM